MNTKHTMVGILGTLGLALGASAACPPEECTGQTLDASRVIHLQPTLESGKVIDLRPSLSTTSGVMEIRPTMLDTRVLALRPVLAQAGQPEGSAKARVRVATRQKSTDEKGDQNMVVVEGGDSISIRMEDGKVVSLERNGKAVPTDRVRKEGERIIILDENGKTLKEFTVGQGAHAFATGQGGFTGAPGQTATAWVATAEPPKVMIGVQLGEPDGLLLGHFGLEPGSATLITGVYDDLPAGKAGLKPYDIIVGVNGKEPAGQTDVREALRDLDAGDKVTLSIIHKGERKDVKLTLVKYDQEALENAELDAIEKDTMAFSFGGDGNNVMVAPGLPPMRSLQGVDPDKMREFAENWRLEADKLAERYRGQTSPGGQAPRWEMAVPGGPATPTPPGAAAPRAANDERWQRLEERMERLEKLIERLAEQRSGAGNR